MSKNRYLTINGTTMPMYKWAEHVGIPAKTIASRMENGLSPEEAVFKPARSLGRERAKQLIRKGLGAERMVKLRNIIRDIRKESEGADKNIMAVRFG